MNQMIPKTDSRTCAVLELIATGKVSTRQDIAEQTELSKTAVSDVVGELIRMKYVTEADQLTADGRAGRRALRLELHPEAPVCCGMLVSRGEFAVVITSLDGTLLAVTRRSFTDITAERLCGGLIEDFTALQRQTDRRIAAIGIATLGPINTLTRTITVPPNFFGIRNLPIADIIEKATGLPTFFMHDTGAAALAERLWGAGRFIDDYIYLQIFRGIGAAFMLGGKLYEGINGNSGELGHVSIDYNGEKCTCGGSGCLESYASVGAISREIGRLRRLGMPTTLRELKNDGDAYSWRQVLAACAERDFAAMAALDQFCNYMSAALASTISLLNIETLILGCEGGGDGVLEDMLERRLSERLRGFLDLHLKVIPSPARDNAPLLGSAAIVARKIFDGELIPA